MFKEARKELMSNWDMIGDINEGRPNLGELVDVSVYRLMQFTLRDVLIRDYDPETADKIFYNAGRQAGILFFKQTLSHSMTFNDFVSGLQDILLKLKIGMLRIEQSDLDNMNFTLTVAEDLDCSGLPVSDETICTYDEGFISGLFDSYTGLEFDVKEVDCWCSGDRVCRFEVKKKND